MHSDDLLCIDCEERAGALRSVIVKGHTAYRCLCQDCYEQSKETEKQRQLLCKRYGKQWPKHISNYWMAT